MASFRIRDLIEESIKVGNRVTQTDLAKAANVAIPTITRIANNQRTRPDPDTLRAIADTFTKALGRKITIDDLIEENGDPPSSLTDVRSYGQPIIVEPTEKYDPLGEGETMRVEDAVPVDDENFVAVPILGDIPYGDLNQVGRGNIVGYEWKHKSLVKKGEFFLRARGMSMAPKIEDGDLLLVKPGNNWNNGTIVAAYVDGEVTCKKLYLKNNHAVLTPTNSSYDPIVVTDEITIIGKVTNVWKQF